MRGIYYGIERSACKYINWRGWSNNWWESKVSRDPKFSGLLIPYTYKGKPRWSIFDASFFEKFFSRSLNKNNVGPTKLDNYYELRDMPHEYLNPLPTHYTFTPDFYTWVTLTQKLYWLISPNVIDQFLLFFLNQKEKISKI